MICAARAGDVLSRFESQYSPVATYRRVYVDAFFGSICDASQPRRLHSGVIEYQQAEDYGDEDSETETLKAMQERNAPSTGLLDEAFKNDG